MNVRLWTVVACWCDCLAVSASFAADVVETCLAEATTARFPRIKTFLAEECVAAEHVILRAEVVVRDIEDLSMIGYEGIKAVKGAEQNPLKYI